MNSRTILTVLAFMQIAFVMLLTLFQGFGSYGFHLNSDVVTTAYFATCFGAFLCGIAAATMPRELE